MECLNADWLKKRQAFDEHMVHSIPGIKDMKFAENNWQNILKQIQKQSAERKKVKEPIYQNDSDSSDIGWN